MRVPPAAAAAEAVITAYLTTISSRDFPSLPGYFSPSATWWISGHPSRVPQAGTRPALDQLPLLPNLLSRFDEYSYNIVNIVSAPAGAEDSGSGRVIVEAQAVGTGPLDLVYVNNITSSYVVGEDGKIQSVREYPEHKEIEWLLEWFESHENATST